ncbi:MAG: 50S ribosomal protein L6 [Ignavibacteriales bacterium]|nr:50S ribosomal protein L6 [Ignavibacteriaceae bacterium]NLH62112.1 50S ribosomal protein L6 [Ignavibacteriales bacterium]HOJ17812.1 50S ribosomal protein L6 [Ignavibacteriaceae bacterium]
MSRIGKKPVVIPPKVTIDVKGNKLVAKGPKGNLEANFHPNMKIDVQDGIILVTRPDDLKENKALHGLSRALIQNIITGVSIGYSKTLDIVGVGYRVEQKGSALLINIGYSHPIYFIPPEGITVQATTATQIVVSGIDKELVGAVAAKIRSFRKPEPYKGKGIKYSNEVIRRKAGKTAGK